MAKSVIELRRLRVMGHHGVGDAERAAAQPFELDIDVTVDAATAGLTDDVRDTVDYGEVTREAVEVVSTQSFQLLEALAQALADSILRHREVEEVTVTVRKLRPPVEADLRSAAVRLTRAR